MNHKQIRTIFHVALFLICLSACGQKGDLYLPTTIPEAPADSEQESRDK